MVEAIREETTRLVNNGYSLNGHLEVLDTFIVCQQGGFRCVLEYVRGWYPELGRLHVGYQGQETIIEKDILTPTRTFNVIERISPNGHRNGSSPNGKIL